MAARRELIIDPNSISIMSGEVKGQNQHDGMRVVSIEVDCLDRDNLEIGMNEDVAKKVHNILGRFLEGKS